jgi:antitoxin PrlF
MPQYRTKVGADGTIALPAALRKKLKITEGSEVEFYLSLDGDVFFHAITGTAKSWRGLFETEVRAPPVSIREMDQAIGEAVADDDRRIRSQAARRTPRHRRTAAE